MRADTTTIYRQCLKDKGIEERFISKGVIDKLRSYSYILVKSNRTASSEQLIKTFSDILNQVLEHPDSDIPPGKLFI